MNLLTQGLHHCKRRCYDKSTCRNSRYAVRISRHHTSRRTGWSMCSHTETSQRETMEVMAAAEMAAVEKGVVVVVVVKVAGVVTAVVMRVAEAEEVEAGAQGGAHSLDSRCQGRTR